MAVGDIQQPHLRHQPRQGTRRSCCCAPDRVPHAVHRREVQQRRAGGNLAGDLVDRGHRRVRQEYRSGLGPQIDDVPRPVVFLVFPGLLMLADDIGVVLVDRVARGDSGLHVAAHLQAIHVQARLVFANERRRRDQPLEVRLRGLVDDVGVWVSVWRKAELGARDMEEAERIAFGQLPGFLGGHHVVGHRSDSGRGLRRRTKSAKRED